MNTFAYCDPRYIVATREASGVEPLTCPPVDAAMLVSQYAEKIKAAQLIYFNFHAAPEGNIWSTAGGIAMTEATIDQLDLHGAVIFMVNCYAGGGLLAALQVAQPKAIIGGFGENLGGVERLAGADLLGLWVRRGLAAGLTAEAALLLAKARLSIGAQTDSVKDALQFELLYERNPHG